MNVYARFGMRSNFLSCTEQPHNSGHSAICLQLAVSVVIVVGWTGTFRWFSGQGWLVKMNAFSWRGGGGGGGT
eukprot:3801361-Amphidinium_carterae.3